MKSQQQKLIHILYIAHTMLVNATHSLTHLIAYARQQPKYFCFVFYFFLYSALSCGALFMSSQLVYSKWAEKKNKKTNMKKSTRQQSFASIHWDHLLLKYRTAHSLDIHLVFFFFISFTRRFFVNTHTPVIPASIKK